MLPRLWSKPMTYQALRMVLYQVTLRRPLVARNTP